NGFGRHRQRSMVGADNTSPPRRDGTPTGADNTGPPLPKNHPPSKKAVARRSVRQPQSLCRKWLRPLMLGLPQALRSPDHQWAEPFPTRTKCLRQPDRQWTEPFPTVNNAKRPPPPGVASLVRSQARRLLLREGDLLRRLAVGEEGVRGDLAH